MSVQDFVGKNSATFTASASRPRVKSARALATDVTTLAELLRETAEHHDRYEKTHAEHHWSDWYAPYLSARQNGSSPEEAAAAADRHMEDSRTR